MTTVTSACPSGDERVTLFGLLLETNARLSKELGEVLESRCGLPLSWFDALLWLQRAPDHRLKMSEVASAIVHSTGGTTRLVDRLVAAGYVSREHCDADRRSIWVRLSPSGEAKLAEALAVHIEFLEARMTVRLDDEERTALRALLSKLNEG